MIYLRFIKYQKTKTFSMPLVIDMKSELLCLLVVSVQQLWFGLFIMNSPLYNTQYRHRGHSIKK